VTAWRELRDLEEVEIGVAAGTARLSRVCGGFRARLRLAIAVLRGGPAELPVEGVRVRARLVALREAFRAAREAEESP
jgi:hypothetical protein